ncbi:small EDRK-rich factor 1 [Peromyscus californicus insignis]|uniref:small EDRK-rich factor 1 n=1 Tax=Peromyscus californicus insignis TaxID=564181 RepID=UPI0022A67FF9|nr:small EDRK-rich factor 1 [Peromyscus californicus insignis]
MVEAGSPAPGAHRVRGRAGRGRRSASRVPPPLPRPGRARAVARRPRRGCCGSVGGAAGCQSEASPHREPARGSAFLSAGRRAACRACERPVCSSKSLSSGLRPAVGMARGNQRELARQKNMKKTQEISKGKRKEDSLTTSQRKQRDSEIMQQKQKIANEKKSMQTREK